MSRDTYKKFSSDLSHIVSLSSYFILSVTEMYEQIVILRNSTKREIEVSSGNYTHIPPLDNINRISLLYLKITVASKRYNFMSNLLYWTPIYLIFKNL